MDDSGHFLHFPRRRSPGHENSFWRPGPCPTAAPTDAPVRRADPGRRQRRHEACADVCVCERRARNVDAGVGGDGFGKPTCVEDVRGRRVGSPGGKLKWPISERLYRVSSSRQTSASRRGNVSPLGHSPRPIFPRGAARPVQRRTEDENGAQTRGARQRDGESHHLTGASFSQRIDVGGPARIPERDGDKSSCRQRSGPSRVLAGLAPRDLPLERSAPCVCRGREPRLASCQPDAANPRQCARPTPKTLSREEEEENENDADTRLARDIKAALESRTRERERERERENGIFLARSPRRKPARARRRLAESQSTATFSSTF